MFNLFRIRKFTSHLKQRVTRMRLLDKVFWGWERAGGGGGGRFSRQGMEDLKAMYLRRPNKI